MSKTQSASTGLKVLKANYRKNLPAKLAQVRNLWADIEVDGWQEDHVRNLHFACHQLVGTAETFGFPDVTLYAREITNQLNLVFDSKTAPSGAAIEALKDALAGLNASDPSLLEEHEPQADEKTVDKNEPGKVQPLSTLPIYIVEDDTDLANHIAMELALHGYEARPVYSLEELHRQVRDAGSAIGAIIMDIIFPNAVTGGIDSINELRKEQILKAPVIFISASDSFNVRLEVVRAGGDAFFAKPFDTHLLIEKLELLIGESNPDPLRVLVVDDDDISAEMIQYVLEDAGLQVQVITNPTKVIDEVLEFSPDLVMLDMYMPEANGMEVAQILRQHETCSELPLLFLSAESDPEIRAEALNIGVDDFLIKPVDHRYLVSAVANRAQRARATGAKIFRDSLTHLLVHDEIKVQLADLLAISIRNSRNLSYAILDLDNFKRINDTFGHLTGDHVIKSLASLLRRSFRRSDAIGRYGGEEFAVIMQDTTIEQAVMLMDRVRAEFSEIRHVSEANGDVFAATFSAGISGFPDYREPEQILVKADRALYDAKAAGRNQVCSAGGPDQS